MYEKTRPAQKRLVRVKFTGNPYRTYRTRINVNAPLHQAAKRVHTTDRTLNKKKRLIYNSKVLHNTLSRNKAVINIRSECRSTKLHQQKSSTLSMLSPLILRYTAIH